MNELDHRKLIADLATQFGPVMEKSSQAVYLYLDDNHKVCNKTFAELFGYESPDEWAEMEAPLADVVAEDQSMVVRAYRAAVQKFKATTLSVRFHNVKTHRTFRRRLTVVPLPFKGQIFTANFIDKT